MNGDRQTSRVETGERWVGAEDVAAHLGVGKESVYRWVESRGLPAHRVGRLFRFRLSEVDDWVAASGRDRAAQALERRVDRVAERRSAYAARPKWPLEPEEITAAIDEMVRIIVEKFDPERIVLFGSHARANAGPDSDVDLLVVMDPKGSKREKQIEIGVALHDIRLPKDIIVVTPEELEKYRDIAGTIIRPAMREGVTLYQRGA
jgi:excisionase family DNA binding protein